MSGVIEKVSVRTSEDVEQLVSEIEGILAPADEAGNKPRFLITFESVVMSAYDKVHWIRALLIDTKKNRVLVRSAQYDTREEAASPCHMFLEMYMGNPPVLEFAPIRVRSPR